MTTRRISQRRLPRLVMLGALATAACTGPERDAFPEDPTTTGATGSQASTGASSPTSSSSTASSNDGGGGTGGGPTGSGGDGGGPSPGAGGDPGQGNGGSGGDATSAGGAPPSCGTDDDGVCVPPPPAGWAGPVVIMERPTGIPTPSCVTTNYPTQLGFFLGEIDEGSATCDCDCEPATGIVCAGDATACYDSDFTQCTLGCTGPTQSLPPDSCIARTNTALQFAGAVLPNPSDPGDCEENLVEAIDEPTWAIEMVMCEGAEDPVGACDGSRECVAVPGGDTASLCVLHAGDVDCPAVFTTKRVRYTDVTEGRSCSACECGTPTSTCGSITFTKSDGGACSGSNTLEIASLTGGQCGEVTDPNSANDANGVVYDQDPAGSCGASSVEIEGEVELAGETTVCCME